MTEDERIEFNVTVECAKAVWDDLETRAGKRVKPGDPEPTRDGIVREALGCYREFLHGKLLTVDEANAIMRHELEKALEETLAPILGPIFSDLAGKPLDCEIEVAPDGDVAVKVIESGGTSKWSRFGNGGKFEA